MRPPGGSFSTFCILLYSIAIVFLMGLTFALPAVAADPDQATATTARRAPIMPTLKAEQGLVFQSTAFRNVVINKKVYRLHRDAKLYGLNGQLIDLQALRPGDIVDIQYLTGGTRNEGYPFERSERVLTTLRVVAKAKK
jgi:hypothetical protein